MLQLFPMIALKTTLNSPKIPHKGSNFSQKSTTPIITEYSTSQTIEIIENISESIPARTSRNSSEERILIDLASESELTTREVQLILVSLTTKVEHLVG